MRPGPGPVRRQGRRPGDFVARAPQTPPAHRNHSSGPGRGPGAAFQRQRVCREPAGRGEAPPCARAPAVGPGL